MTRRPRPPAHPLPRARHGGAALLTAMLTVALVASLAATALWQQWRSVEVEAAERQRSQMAWVLVGALDWSRLILQEDARSSGVDHLSEPWALPLQEARLSSFLAVDKANTDATLEAFLSGEIQDQQGLLNLRNLLENGQRHAPSVTAATRLFLALDVPLAELELLLRNWELADAAAALGPTGASGPRTSVLREAPWQPTRLAHLQALGLSAASLQRLAPYVTLLPVRTSLNLNTAPPLVLHAVLPLDQGQARQLALQRSGTHFKQVTDALQLAGVPAARVDAGLLGVGSRYFVVRGRLRWGDTTVQESSLLERDAGSVRVLWRVRETPRFSP